MLTAQLGQIAQFSWVQGFLNSSKCWFHSLSRPPGPCSAALTINNFLPRLVRISFPAACVHCLLCFHHALPRKALTVLSPYPFIPFSFPSSILNKPSVLSFCLNIGASVASSAPALYPFITSTEILYKFILVLVHK